MPGGRNPESERAQRGEVARFIADLYEKAGYTTQAELARDLRIESSRVSHWMNPTGNGRGPSAFNLLQVLRAAERRKVGATAGAADEDVAARLRALEGVVEESGKETERAVRSLAKDLRSLTRRLDRGDDQATAGG